MASRRLRWMAVAVAMVIVVAVVAVVVRHNTAGPEENFSCRDLQERYVGSVMCIDGKGWE